mmetsp:Transcript_36698/g.103553  ORF Transcript_36698/g.103553 Transcript_36698/m.103553 type:complete len:339 (+) Transcript_36698:57-1073(+)
MRPDVHTYRTRMGEEPFRQAIAGLVGDVYGEKVGPDNVLAVAGVAGGVSAALFHLRKSRPEATVAIMEPFYTYHSLEVERAFCRPARVVPTKGEAPEANWEELRRLVEAGEVQGVILTNPLNPSGHVYTAEEVSAVLELSDATGLFVIFDECYLDMVFNGKVHASPLVGGIRKNVVACRGFSKCMGCQSWRCGYALGAPETLLGMMQMMDPLYICTNWTQHALAKYFAEHVDDFKKHCKSLNEILQGNWFILRDAFQKRFGWSSIEPDGTMYAMFKHDDETDIKACERALKAGVGICPGNVFYGDVTSPPPRTGWVRIHCGVSREKAQLIADKLSSGA